MRVVLRYTRLFGYFVAFSFSKFFEFRFDFFMRILMDIIYYLIAISFFRILFLHTPSLGGWNEPQMMIFVAGYCMTDAINMTLFSNNLWHLPRFINKGDLDYYLLRPVSSLFFLTLRDFAANSLINLFCTFGILVWAILRYPEPLAAAKILLFLLLIFNGSLLFCGINMIMTMMAFFSHSGQGFGFMAWSLMRFGERPDRIYQGWTRRILTTLLPFSLIASFPTRLLIEDLDVTTLLHLLGITILFFSMVVWLWNFSLRHYTSASS